MRDKSQLHNMLDEILDYASNKWNSQIAEKAVRTLVYSAIAAKWIRWEAELNQRFRLNVFLFWKPGWLKSSILRDVASWVPLKSSIVTTSTAAALRGSVVDGQFYPPEFLISRLVIFTELGSVIDNDHSSMGEMCALLEEGTIRVNLIKLGNLEKKAQMEMEKMGAVYENGRFSYNTQAPCWVASHTSDCIQMRYRDAFVSRFLTVQLDDCDLPRNILFLVPDNDTSNDDWIRTALTTQFRTYSKPDQAFCGEVLHELSNNVDPSELVMTTPRTMSDIRLIIYAHHELEPTDSVGKVARIARQYLGVSSVRSTREIVADFLYTRPHSMRELMSLTGESKANLYGHISRLKANKRKRRGERTKYWLD